ncbi:MAG: SAP domain-containing protein [Betaproteobacteria bacterium]|nr:SAP domain-containing protein [Betaproteobacteria bacterium]
MKLEEIRSIAKSHKINPGKLSKTELIKFIQTDEGNFDCFATAYGGMCDQMNCLWREDCFAAAQSN